MYECNIDQELAYNA